MNNILSHSVKIQGVTKKTLIDIYPIKIKDYEEFQKYNRLLYVSKGHFPENEYSLLTLIFGNAQALNLTQEELIIQLCRLFSLVTKSEVTFGSLYGIDGFITNKKIFVNKRKIINRQNLISSYNYDEIRSIVMNQNLMFEQKIYKSKITQEWAELALQKRMENQPKIGMEEMLSTVSVLTGKHYWDLEKYTIYQVYSDFYRIRKNKSFDTGILANCQGAGIELEDFAEELDLYKNPYDGLFVSNDKLDKFN